MKKNIIVISCLLIAALFNISCCCESKKIKVDGLKGKVEKVLSGNEIQLQSGLKVELIGFVPSPETKKYLEENVVGQTVELKADSKYTQPQYLKSQSGKVRAYARIGNGYCISGTLLRSHYRYNTDFRNVQVLDSAKNFGTYPVNTRPEKMSQTELRSYLLPRTFMIMAYSKDKDGDIVGWSGTGFFIDENGLALTNHHVLNEETFGEEIYFLGEGGTVINTKKRSIARKVFAYQNGSLDFSIFYVALDPGEKTPFIPLIKEHEKEGEPLAKMGCPANEPANFKANGALSNYLEKYDNHVFVHGLDTYSGDSGSPIVNFRGEAVGINQGENAVLTQDINTGELRTERGTARYAVDAAFIRELFKTDEIAIDYAH